MPCARSQRASQKPSRPASYATAIRVRLRPAFAASPRHRCSNRNSPPSSALSFFAGCRSIPGIMPATSQLDWLISITAINVLFSSRAASDLLRSFGCGMGHPVGFVAAPMMPFSRRSPHSISSNAERGLVLETGAGRGLDEPSDLLPGKHPRQLPRIVRAGQLMGEVGAAERDGEEEAQRRGLRIDRRRLRTLLDLCELEAADVVAARGTGGAADKFGKGFDMPDIVVLRLVANAPDRHVRDHTAAKIADRLVAHRRLLS